MNYFAGAIRENGLSAMNSDALMVKTLRTKDKRNLSVLAICTDESAERRTAFNRLFAGHVRKSIAACTNRMIRAAEELVEDPGDGSGKELCRRIYYAMAKSNFRKRKIGIAVLVLLGRDYFVIRSGGSSIYGITRNEIKPLLEGKERNPKKVFFAASRLTEGTTFLMASKGFTGRLNLDELQKSLCPQMCAEEGDFYELLDFLGEKVRSRGGEKPLSAAALCVK